MIGHLGKLTIGDTVLHVKPTIIRHTYGELATIECDILSSNELNALKNFITEPRLYRAKSKIEKVIFNDPATIVLWSDKTKTVVKCQPGDTYDKEKGLALCIAKKYLGNKGNFNGVFKKWIPEERKVYKDTKDGGPRVNTKIKIIDTKIGCLGARGRVGVVTYEDHISGLLTTDPGYNVKTTNGDVWRINPDAKIEIIN